MPTVRELTDPYLRTYRTVPRSGDRICEICHGVKNAGYYGCYSCMTTRGAVSRPLELVVPISLCEESSQFHLVMWRYKNGTPPVSSDFSLQISALVSRFLDSHGSCIEHAGGGPWDVITSVPSAKRAAHPLEHVLRSAPGVGERVRPLLRPGADPVDRVARDDAYSVTETVRGLRVLLVDDMFTSGASLQSAASALSAAGAVVVAGVPIGRFMKPSWGPEHTAVCEWSAQTVPFDFGACALCGPDYT